MQHVPTRFHSPARRSATDVTPEIASGGSGRTWADAKGRLLAAALLRADARADAWTAEAQTLVPDRGRAAFSDALTRGAETVPSSLPALKALVEELETVPIWVDPFTLDLACRTFRRTGIGAGAVLAGYSLMRGYRSSAIVKTLMLTGKLKYRAAHRLVETGRFVNAVTRPGQLSIGGEGYRSAAHVRWVHSIVRQQVRASEAWREDLWGVPVNQADMLYTNLLFSVGFLRGCRKLGFRFSPEEANAIIHLWRYVGYLMGIEPSLLPADEHEANLAMDMVEATQPKADGDSVELAAALCNAPLDYAQTPLERRLARLSVQLRGGISRFLMGDEVANDLGLPDNAYRYVAPALAPLVAGMEQARARLPFATDAAFFMGDRLIEKRFQVLASRVRQAH